MELEKDTFPLRRVGLALLSLVILAAAQLAAIGIGQLAWTVTRLPALGNGISAVLYPVFALLGLWALCRFGLKESLGACRIAPFRLRPVWCVSAFLLPGLVCGTYLLLPGTWVQAQDPPGVGVMVTSGILFMGFAAAIVEEAVFRGVIMTALERRWGRAAAVLLPSVLFGGVHIIGSDLSPLSMLQLVLAGTAVGVLFSLVALESGNIWNGALIHAVWNSALLCLLHIGPQADPGAFFNYVPASSSFLLTGGEYGVEASLISLAGYLLFAGLAWGLIRKRNLAA